jgi:drug/metabolite transporter (DMT)-like permease
MIDQGIAYALLAACFGGAYIFGIKRYLSGIPPAVIAVVTSLVGVVAYGPFAAWKTARSGGALGQGLDTGALLFAALALGLSAGGYLLFLTALEAGDVSYVAPLSKVVPAFVLPIEIVVLRTLLTPLQLLGVVGVTAGIYVANYQDGRLRDPLLRLASSRAAQFALGSAAVYGAFDVAQRIVLQELGVEPHVWVVATRLGIVALLLPLALRTAIRREIGGAWQGFVLIGVLNAFLAHFGILAFSLLPASVASPIVNAQSIVAVALGGLLLGERAVRYRALGAALAIAGIAFIAAG